MDRAAAVTAGADEKPSLIGTTRPVQNRFYSFEPKIRYPIQRFCSIGRPGISVVNRSTSSLSGPYYLRKQRRDRLAAIRRGYQVPPPPTLKPIAQANGNSFVFGGSVFVVLAMLVVLDGIYIFQQSQNGPANIAAVEMAPTSTATPAPTAFTRLQNLWVEAQPPGFRPDDQETSRSAAPSNPFQMKRLPKVPPENPQTRSSGGALDGSPWIATESAQSAETDPATIHAETGPATIQLMDVPTPAAKDLADRRELPTPAEPPRHEANETLIQFGDAPETPGIPTLAPQEPANSHHEVRLEPIDSSMLEETSEASPDQPSASGHALKDWPTSIEAIEAGDVQIQNLDEMPLLEFSRDVMNP